MSIKKPYFAYRTWSMSTFWNPPLLELTLDRALAEAPRHNINCIEIKDYSGSWVDLAACYKGYPRLAEAEVLTYENGPMTRRQRQERAAFLKCLAQKIHKAGLELQVWYHCFRHWPEEVVEWYPHLREADKEEIYDLIRDNLRDAFDFFPEIDGITVTSLNETPSILRFAAGGSQADRLLRLYRSFVDVCDERGKRLILRDFIVKKSEFDLFDEVLDQLPDWVIIETKDVVADWGGSEKPVNPYICRYAAKKKRLVVEFELSNNYAGEMEIPWCDPEYLWRRIRLMAELRLHGGVGRLVNTDHVVAGTIFDTPNEVMVWAFSRFLVDPGKLLQNPEDHWDRAYDEFDVSVWRDWANLRFGEQAAVEVIDILQQTPRLMNLTLNFCGAHFLISRFNQPDTREERERFKRSLRHSYRSLPGVIGRIERCGCDLARAEKAQAMRIVEDALRRIAAIKDILSPAGYENLHGAYDRSKYIVGIYQAMIEALVMALEVDAAVACGTAAPGCAAGKVVAGEGACATPALAAAVAKLRAAADAATAAYGDRLLEGTPIAARCLAEIIEELPGHADQWRAIYRRERGLDE